MNIVPFGEMSKWDGAGKDYGVVWEDPREIHSVLVTFAGAPPPVESVALEYWQSSWPEHEIPRDAPSGSGSSGWFNVGDWYQGKWQKADAVASVNGNTVQFTFRPLNETEFPDLDKAATYRTTFKLRIVGEEPLPKVERFEAYTDSTWAPLEVEIEWARPACNGRLEVFNGSVERIEPLRAGGGVVVRSDNAWESTAEGTNEGVRARVLRAKTRRYNSFDETVVTVRAGADTFSFSTPDLEKWGHIIVPDFGFIVRVAGNTISYADALERIGDAPEKDLYSRVNDEPEQTFERAWNDVPAKDRQYIPLSFEGGRQHFGMNGEGNVFCNKLWLDKIPGRDTGRCAWDGDELHIGFGLPKDAMTDRTLIDGYLPIPVTVWEEDGVRYKQTALVVPLAGVPKVGARIAADAPLVLMMRYEMSLLSGVKGEARIEISVSDKKPNNLAANKDRIIVADTKPRPLRMLVSDQKCLSQVNGNVLYRADLTNEFRTRSLDIAIPYITLNDPEDGEEWRQLRALQFGPALEAACAYWRARIDQGARVSTPVPMINDFYKAHLPHLLINTERDVSLRDGEPERYMAKVGTFYYGVFANEACMMISDLDRRGYHDRAREAIETWFHYQGSRKLPGDYASTAGMFYGAGGYEDPCGYNQHHGWVLWCIGEHYWYTRDDAWLARVRPNIVKACEWIAGERLRNKEAAARSPLRAIENGLLPPGSLEDIADWRCWMSNNVYSWWGLHNAAAALADAGFPEGATFAAEAAAYKADIVAAFTEAMRRSPVVRLRDGSWVPHIPSDAHRRGRSFGWITETLEGAIHLVRCGLLEPNDRISTWIIKDYEDNLYLSEQYGYDLKGEEFERHWFSRGGISQQANLLCNPIAYLLRDEPEHFLRAYFNAFAVSYFSDTRMMTEHALPNIGDWRGDHYKSSDEANSTYWLRLMFLQERGEDLWVGAALPRYWLAQGKSISLDNAATYFGPASVSYQSDSATKITAVLQPPVRNKPRTICVRFRHPDKARMTRCEVNGLMYADFDPQKEWVTLHDCGDRTEITAFYD